MTDQVRLSDVNDLQDDVVDAGASSSDDVNDLQDDVVDAGASSSDDVNDLQDDVVDAGASSSDDVNDLQYDVVDAGASSSDDYRWLSFATEGAPVPLKSLLRAVVAMQPIIPFLLLQLWFQCSSAFYASKLGDPEVYSHAGRMLDTGAFPTPSRSAYASDGIVKPFVGDVQTNEQLLVALEHCSHKKEVILLSSTDHIMSIDAAAQTIWMLGRFGIAHVMLITGSAEACASNAENLPRACCVWAAPELPSGNRVASEAFGNHRKLAHFRLRIASHTDIVIMDDPYKFFKGPLFADKHFMADGHAMEVNIGVMYVQNIAPDGPVAWVFAETVDRQLSFNHTWMHMHQTLVNPYVKEKEVTLTEELKKHF
eukprot:gene17457-23759_t